MTIDAHHHFWRYDPREYAWISPEMSRIRRDFLPDHLHREITAAGIHGVISVQARQTVEETRWLLQMAAKHDWIKGVVGWAPLTATVLPRVLAELKEMPKLVGVRHVLQEESDDFASRDDFNAGIAALKNFGLCYDVLIVERQLPQAISLVDRHPNQIFILDHVAKPKIRTGEIEPWRANIRRIAERENAYCKVSGMVTEADWQRWSPSQLKSYFDVVLEAFGPRRLMFGSDWPVCLLACEYSRWKLTVDELTSSLSSAERARIMGGSAVEAYALTSA
jgi:L-fuconolactonase